MPISYKQLINQALADGVITFAQYGQIPWNERDSMEYLFSPDGRQALADDIITLEQYLQTPVHERQNLMAVLQYGRQAIADGIITLEQYRQFPLGERRNIMIALQNPAARQAIAEGVIPLEEYLQVPSDQRQTLLIELQDPAGREALADGIITLEQYRQTPPHERRNIIIALQNPDVRQAIADGMITFGRYLQIPSDELWDMPYLFSPDGRQAMADGIITLEQYLDIPSANRQTVMIALQDPDTRQRIINGQMTTEGVIALVHANANAVAAAVAAAAVVEPNIEEPNVNDRHRQSTHTTSVHQTVSESATRLAARYRSRIDGANLETIISNIRAYIGNLPDDSQKDTAAKRCFSRLADDPNYRFMDPRSEVTTRQLLALMFLAIHDDENRIGLLEDAEIQCVEALYEIQRGYNISERGEDDGKADNRICAAGAFNKLIEKLQGIHPDCEILFITRESASRKLPIVVRETAMLHLASLANPNTTTAKKQLRFTALMAEVKKDGLEKTIWVDIKGPVSNRMFREFGSLYQTITNPDFIELVEYGKDVELDNLLNPLQKIDLPLGELENKGKNLLARAHTLASDKVSNIVRLLCELNYKYFVDKDIDYMAYKTSSLEIINQERPELDKHRGYKQILGNLSLLIFTLGTVQLLNKTCLGGKFLFFNKTDSSTYIDQLSNVIEEIEYNSLSNSLS